MRNRSVSVRDAALLLGVRSGATTQDVIQARRVQAKIWHPDVNREVGSLERMGRINQACDILCDFIRRGGRIVVGAGRRARRPPMNVARGEGRVYEPVLADGAGPVQPPDRLARVEVDLEQALGGGIRRVSFARLEPERCHACAGMGASPVGPKRVCPECEGDACLVCGTCDGRGWVHVWPNSCASCGGTGAGLVERAIRLRIPPLVSSLRAYVDGWGDVAPDGTAGRLWLDLVPASTLMPSGPWRFERFGHNWPRPAARLDGGWLSINNSPLPDEEMRDLGFWRDPSTTDWVREASADVAHSVVEQIVQRQFFVPQARGVNRVISNG